MQFCLSQLKIAWLQFLDEIPRGGPRYLYHRLNIFCLHSMQPHLFKCSKDHCVSRMDSKPEKIDDRFFLLYIIHTYTICMNWFNFLFCINCLTWHSCSRIWSYCSQVKVTLLPINLCLWKYRVADSVYKDINTVWTNMKGAINNIHNIQPLDVAPPPPPPLPPPIKMTEPLRISTENQVPNLPELN